MYLSFASAASAQSYVDRYPELTEMVAFSAAPDLSAYTPTFGPPPARPTFPLTAPPAEVAAALAPQTPPEAPPPEQVVLVLASTPTLVPEPAAVSAWVIVPAAPAAVAAPTPAAAASIAAQAPEQPGWAASLSLRAASAYAYRGLNFYGRDQHELAAVVAPGVSASRGPWSLGWSTAVQASGGHFAATVANGTGHEQNGWVGVAGQVGQVALAGSVTGTVMPFADAAIAGATMPASVEPAGAVTVGADTQLTLGASVLKSVQGTLRGGDHGYLSTAVTRTAALPTEAASLVFGASGGTKAVRGSRSVEHVRCGSVLGGDPRVRRSADDAGRPRDLDRPGWALRG